MAIVKCLKAVIHDLTGFRRFHSPICFDCRHFYGEKGRMTCSAYPVEIPDRIVFGAADAHDSVQADQVDTAVFVEVYTNLV